MAAALAATEVIIRRNAAYPARLIENLPAQLIAAYAAAEAFASPMIVDSVWAMSTAAAHISDTGKPSALCPACGDDLPAHSRT
jgi:hypothetical protein